MIFSKQKWFCNICGQEQFSEIKNNNHLGAMLCSAKCVEEFKWRRCLSILGKEYYQKDVTS